MRAFAHLFDPATGVRAAIDVGEADNVSEYMWTEGNYSCDCNRREFMRLSKVGLMPGEELPSPCGDTIVLEKLVDENGVSLI